MLHRWTRWDGPVHPQGLPQCHAHYQLAVKQHWGMKRSPRPPALTLALFRCLDKTTVRQHAQHQDPKNQKQLIQRLLVCYLHLCFSYWDKSKCLLLRNPSKRDSWLLPWSCRHHRAAGLSAELGDGAVQHVDLVEEVHR